MALVSDIATIRQSGLNHIDALLNSGPGWNWLTPERSILYYTFSVTSGTQIGNGSVGALTAFNAAQQSACLSQLFYISQLTGIVFAAAVDGAAADLHFAATDITGGSSGLCSTSSSYTYYQSNVLSYSADAYVYLDNAEFGTQNGTPTAGGYGYQTLLHELGHALGLKHPFEGDIRLAAAQDNTAYSVMSYTQSGGPYSTFSPYDVAALMWIYGGDGLGGALGISTPGVCLIGSASENLLDGGSGNDSLDGGDGNDSLSGDLGRDSLMGGAGDDTLRSGDQADQLYGGDGNDLMSAGKGLDLLDGGNGNDTLTGGIGNDTVIGGAGIDTADYSTGSDGVTANLVTGIGGSTVSVPGVGSGTDTLTGIENLTGGFYNDSLVGNTGNNVLSGLAGDDTLSGDDGFDTLDGGDGNDNLSGGIKADILNGGLGDDLLAGGQGMDTLDGGNGNDTLRGALGIDVLTGGLGADHFVFASVLDSLLNIDTITDFQSGTDVIELSAAIFSAFSGQVGNTIGLNANLIYTAGTGALAYDADGAGAGAPITFALLGATSHPASLGSDFRIVT